MLKMRNHRKKRVSSRPRYWNQFEQLENRICLSVSASVDNGVLRVQGEAENDVVITAVGEETYTVTEGGVSMTEDPITEVTKGFRIHLEDGETNADDRVTIDLAEQTVDRVLADLGGGNNTLVLTGGTVDGSLHYKGRDGNDTVTVNDSVVITKDLVARLGGGDNTLTHNGQIGRNLIVRSANQNDTVTAGNDSVGRATRITLGAQAGEGGHFGRGKPFGGGRAAMRQFGPRGAVTETDRFAGNLEDRIAKLEEAIASGDLPENLTLERATEILEALKNGERPPRPELDEETRQQKIDSLREAIESGTLPEHVDAERAAEILAALENGELPHTPMRGRGMMGAAVGGRGFGRRR